MSKKKILIAPLFWGIGHATRCVPIINALLKNGFEPIIASDGFALEYLKNEFPKLTSYELPAYDIRYPKRKFLLKMSLFFQSPRILKAIKKEHQVVAKIIKKEKISGIISDNRFGVYSADIPSVYITHQVTVLSGLTTFFTSKIHQKIISKFDECWIPDSQQVPKLAGKLSQTNSLKISAKYIGVLSRFKKENTVETKYNYKYLVLLSGTEPQRSLLENKLISELSKTNHNILFVRGILNEEIKIKNTKNIQFINFLNQAELQKAINESEIVIARSGYSTIMDLAVLNKKAFFIPTPGQTEQEYLAEHLEVLKIAPFSKQHNFKVEQLKKVTMYNGFTKDIITPLVFPFEIF